MIKSNIIELPIELSNMIAAGEVVERPASIVKELVENSIDAKSTVIRIDLENSGLRKITIIDNGIGMSKDDMEMALKPHSTSKIKTPDDLFSINTLGFRGEALPSIASISKVKISSSINGYEGYYKYFVAGKLNDEKIVSFPKGTKIEVEDIFFNTPARFKHLSSEPAELSHIVQYINKCALAYKEISFVLTNNNKVIFSTDGSNDAIKIISEIYGTDIAKSMLEFDGKNSLYQIKGFTSSNSVFRSNRNSIIILVNNRVIKNQNIIYAITDAYKTILPIGKYPITILEINTDPSVVDVNVHPTKQEIRFTDEAELRRLITSTIIDTINKVNLVYQTNFSDNQKEEYISSYAPSYKNNNYTDSKAIKTFTWDDFDFEKPVENKELKEVVSENYQASTTDIDETVYVEQKLEFEQRENNFFKELTYIGQFNKTYLVLEKETSLYLIDQHAAMERIMYEKIKTSFAKESNEFYELIVPIKYDLSLSEMTILKTKEEEFTKIGIAYEYFGNNTILIRTLPLWVPESLQIEYISDIMNHILSQRLINKNIMYDSLAKSLSCKKSIKANMLITNDEVATLLNDLDKCDNPFTCPHGRPTVIHFSNYEIEKLFKRVI